MDDDVLLLPKSGRAICRLKAGKQFLYEDANIQFGATYLKNFKDCKSSPDDYFLAVFSSLTKSFRSLPLVASEDETFTPSLPGRKKILDQALKVTKQKGLFEFSDLSARTDVFHLPAGLVTVKLASYELKRSGRGPVMAEVSGRSQILGDICSQPLRAFELDQQVYILVGSFCCDCGWAEKILFRYNGTDEIEKLYSSRDFPKM